MGIRYKQNSSGIRAILNSQATGAALDAVAEPTLGRMQSNCPVESGTLEGSLEVWTEHTDRIVKRVGTRTVDYALEVEADTGFMARSL